MGRAGLFQGEVIVQNILDMIRGRHPAATYVPNLIMEGALKLTLGKASSPNPKFVSITKANYNYLG